jgi:hypothetical protein
MAVKVFRSTDSNAPIVTAQQGSLTQLLDACLVAGYGATRATGTITQSGQPANNDTITVGGTTYTFKTALTPAANEVFIGATAAATLANLAAAIGGFGVVNTNYGTGTVPHQTIQVTANSGTVLTLTAYVGGTGGNALVLTESATNYVVSGSGTLSGGSGSVVTTSCGWSKPYTANSQATFRPASGVQHYFHVDDAAPNATAYSLEGQVRGSETATAFMTGTNFFPTVAQVAAGAGMAVRKSTGALSTNRAWIVIADERTCYVLIYTGDSAAGPYSVAFGEIYSYLATTDLFRSIAIGRGANSGLIGSDNLPILAAGIVGGTVGFHFMPRTYTGLGTSIQVGKLGHYTKQNGAQVCGAGGVAAPDPVTGAVLIHPVEVTEPTAQTVRGRMRGYFCPLHPATAFTDGDTVTGSGAYAGRTFLLVKQLGTNGVSAFDITGPWETN